MKRFTIVCLVMAAMAVMVSGCGARPAQRVDLTGSGQLIRVPLDLEGFSQIDANSAAQMSFTRGDEFRVELQIDDNLEPYLEVEVRGDTLYIGLRDGSYTGITFQAQMVMPELTGATLNGGSSLRGEMAGEDLALDLNGASLAILGGTAGHLTVEANGGSQALLSDLAAQDVKVNANRASRVQLNASGEVTGEANGASNVTVGGSPTRVDVDANGASSVTRE